jgi:serine/threonine protein kinase
METALENSVWVTSPEFAGWLVKRGFRWRKLWTKRWVALHGTEIAYMAEEPNERNSKTMAVTKCQIVPATVVHRDDVDGHPHGFAIHINDGVTPVWYLRAESTREKKSWLMRLGHVQDIVKWLDSFEKVKVLGVGATGIVYELKHKVTGKRFALKEMEIKNKAQMQMALSEAEMLKEIMENISHPNIMHIDKVFQVGLKFYLVFPLCTGGELYEHVIRRGHFSERDAAVITHDLLSGLHALHTHDILHLDIKPENILFETDADDARIKITDFGLSKVFNQRDANGSVSAPRPTTMEDMAAKLKQFQECGVLQRDRLRGTVGYMSPELILAGVSSAATDVWAAGVVVYILLCGHPPFQSKSNREILERSARGQYSLDGKEWEGVSEEAKDIVRRMLTVDPDKRITIVEALEHPWVRSGAPAGSQDKQTKGGASVGSPLKAAVSSSSAPSTPTTKAKPIQDAPDSGAANPSRTANLSNALHALSTHVKDRRMEKMAVSFTKLVSSLQNDTKQQDRRRMIDTLLDREGNLLEASSDNEGLFVLSPDYKDAMSAAFGAVGMSVR